MENLFMQMWIMDYQFGFADKDYFKSLVQRGYLSATGYQKIVGEAYVASQSQPEQQPQG
jgi:hypothetical protein